MLRCCVLRLCAQVLVLVLLCAQAAGAAVCSVELCAQVLVLEPSEETPELDFQQPHRTLEAAELVLLPKSKALLFDQFARAQATQHSTAHSTHHTG